MTPTRGSDALLSAALRAWINSGVSTIVASRSKRHHPSLMRAVGSSVSSDDASITVYLDEACARPVLDDIGQGGGIAVVFSEPSTNRTVQVKSRHASCRRCGVADVARLEAYRQAMESQLQCIGIGTAFTRAMLAYRLDRLVALSFAPEQAFDQTPGPRAGTSIEPVAINK